MILFCSILFVRNIVYQFVTSDIVLTTRVRNYVVNIFHVIWCLLLLLLFCFRLLYHLEKAFSCLFSKLIFRLDALALSVIATATWLGGWVSVTAGIVPKRLNLSENFLDHLVGPSFKHLRPLTPIPNSMVNPFIGGVKYTGGWKIGNFRSIFDVHRRLSRKWCEIGR